MVTTAQPTQPSQLWNLPNILTMFRIVLVPVFVGFMIGDGSHQGPLRWFALLAFAIAMYTDQLDGQIARRRNLVTNFGKIADPIADKLLTGAALVLLSALGELPWWVTIVILVREWGITALRFVVIRYGVMPASRGGKLKTVLQTVALVLYILPLRDVAPAVPVVAFVVMLAAVAITVATGVDYIVKAARLRAAALRER